MKLNLKKLSIAQLVRQLKVVGMEVDPKTKFTKDELIDAFYQITKNKIVKEVEITDEVLKGLVELGLDIKFKVGEFCFVIIPEELDKPPVEVGAAPVVPKKIIFWNPPPAGPKN